ncbi:transcriptional regulator [Cytobacillus sp. Hm23]
MFGLGKKRTKFGKWIDKRKIKQIDIEKNARLGRATISNMCNNPDYVPRISTWVKIERALKKMGFNVRRDDFFDV